MHHTHNTQRTHTTTTQQKNKHTIINLGDTTWAGGGLLTRLWDNIP